MEILDKIIYRYLAKKDYPEIAVLVNDCVGFREKLVKISEMTKDYNLITAVSKNSKFNLK